MRLLISVIVMLLTVAMADAQDTLMHTFGLCTLKELHETDTADCPPGINFSYENDSLMIFGIIEANCCGTHLVLIENIEDTILLNSLDTGDLCDCMCEFCFEIILPIEFNDTIVVINGSIYHISAIVNGVSRYISEDGIRIYPNPATEEINIGFDDGNRSYPDKIALTDIYGKEIVLIEGNEANVMNLAVGNIRSGVYILKCYAGSELIYIARFVKV